MKEEYQSENLNSGNSMSSGYNESGDTKTLPYAAPVATKSKKGCGCWVLGCLGSAFAGVLLVSALGVGGYWWVSQQVEKYTDTAPGSMPTVEMNDEDLAELRGELDSFFNLAMPEADGTNENTTGQTSQMADDGENESTVSLELVLTADQINALLQSNETFADRAFVEIEDGRIVAKISIPTDQFPGGAGRHFNADADIEVSLEDGILLIQIIDAKVKGEPLPEGLMTELSKQNLAKEMYEDADTAKIIRRFESIEVVGNTVRLRLKPPARPEPQTQGNAQDSSSQKSTAQPVDTELPAEASRKRGELIEQPH